MRSMSRRGRNPWWIPPFLGRIPGEVEETHLRLLGAVALALLFEEYDLAMLTSALKYIAFDLGMAQADLGHYLAVTRLGALPAFLLIPLSDRLGRRRVFVVSVAAMGVLTVGTALSATPGQFVALQALTRTFFVAGSAVAIVIVTEEFPASSRGWAIGMLGALGAAGHGLEAILFSQIEHIPGGWRGLYMVGVAPLLLVPYFLRRIPETRRFADHMRTRQANAISALAWLHPLRDLASRHPARALAVGATGFLPGLGVVAAFQFTGYFTQTVHQWTPAQYSLMIVAGGIIGIAGSVLAGRMADLIGRRRVGFVLLSLFPVFVALFYQGPAWVVPLAWIAFLFCSAGGRIILRALSAELFPTEHRGTASGAFSVLETVGAAIGLWLVGIVTRETGDIGTAASLMACAVFVAATMVLALPETRGRELEEIDTGETPRPTATLSPGS